MRALTARLAGLTAAILVAVLGAPSATSAQPAATHHWTFTASHRVLPFRDQPASLSCPTAGFCLATDNADAWSVERSGRWSKPARIGNGIGLIGASCASERLCFALVRELSGDIRPYRYDGSRWSAVRVSASEELAMGAGVTCVPKHRRCLFYGLFVATFWTGHFSPTFTPDSLARGRTSEDLLELGDCSSTTLCVLGDYTGHVVLWRGAHWSAPHQVFNNHLLVACVGSRFCVAGTTTRARTWNGTSWSAVKRYGVKGHRVSAFDIACGAPNDCVVIGNGGSSQLTKGRWSRATSAHYEGTIIAVQCPTATRCQALSLGGDVLTGNESGLAPTATADEMSAATAISCPTTTFCAVVDDTGHVAIRHGKHWTHHLIATGVGQWFIGLSCTSPTFCMAVNGDGNLYRYNGSQWSKLATPVESSLPSSPLVLSCASRHLCGFAENGELATITNGHTVVADHANGHLQAISCPTDHRCFATDARGGVYTWNGSTWSPRKEIAPSAHLGVGLDQISCSSATHCLAGGSGRDALLLEWNGRHWTNVPISDAPVDALDCYSSTSCLESTGSAHVVHGTNLGTGFAIPHNFETAGDLGDLLELSCPSATHCVSLDSDSGVAFGVR
jgi:hypothetical protein